MKRIWARIGMSLDISDTDYKNLLAAVRHRDGTIDDYEFDTYCHLMSQFMEQGIPDGESYIPAVIFEDIENSIHK